LQVMLARACTAQFRRLLLKNPARACHSKPE
jgi:hypothetical protein